MIKNALLLSGLILLSLPVFFTSGTAVAQSQAFESGYQAYMRNQFPLAEAYFKRALSSAATNEDKAFILKFMGISQYMRGARRQAANSFYKAYQADAKTSIYQEEVLDPGVVQFFNALKTKWDAAAAKANASANPPSSSQSTAPQASKQPNKTAESPKKKKTTRQKRSRKVETKVEPNQQQEAESSQAGGLTVWHFLPFGAGHFYNGQYLWASAYLLGEAGLLAYWGSIQANIKSEQDENDTVKQSGIDQVTIDQFVENNNKVIDAYESDAQLTLISFGLTYLVDVTHSILSRPRSEKTASIEQRKAAIVRSLASDEILDDLILSNSNPREPYHVQIRPFASNGLQLSVHWSLD